MENQLQTSLKSCRIIKLHSHRRPLRTIYLLVLFSFLTLTQGCRAYYRVNTKYQHEYNFALGIPNLVTQNKIFIVHFGNEVWWLRSFSLNDDKTALTGILETLPENRYSFLNTLIDRPNHYHRKHEKHVLHEVHLYANEYSKKEDLSVVIPLESIQRMDIYDHHTGATAASFVLGNVVFFHGLVLFAILFILMAF